MFRPFLRLSNLGLLTVFFIVTLTTHADTILVGTSLIGSTPGPELCPSASGCNERFSQFSTAQAFVVDDIKVAISGPIPVFSQTNGNFQVDIVTIPTGPGSPTIVANVGSGSLPLNFNQPPVTEIFDFSGLSILLNPGIQYYLEVTGGNLMWNNNPPPLSGTFGTLGLQLSCDPFANCNSGTNMYDHFSGTYGEQISGDPVPEPSTWSLLAMGLFLSGLLYFNSSSSNSSGILRRVRN